MNLKITYGDEIKNQTVIFRPEEIEIPADQLLDLLRSLLRMRGLALVEGDLEDWYRIVEMGDALRHTSGIHDGPLAADAERSSRVVTQVVPIASDDMSEVVQHARSFLSSPKASIIEIPDKRILLITDFESSIARVLEIIQLVDVAPVKTKLVTVSTKYHDGAAIAKHVLAILEKQAKLEGQAAPSVTVEPDLAAGGLVLLGSEADVAVALDLVQRFDAAPDSFHRTVAYAPHYMSALRLDTLIQNVLIPKTAKSGGLETYLDEESNRLYVTASDQTHAQIARLIEEEDRADLESSRPLRIYRPRNRVASDLVTALSTILPTLAHSGDAEILTAGNAESPSVSGDNPDRRGAGLSQEPNGAQPSDVGGPSANRVSRIEGEDFVLSVDEHTNAIFAIGTREFHTQVERLLAELDRRQPQVRIQVKLVTVTLNDSLSLAIEGASADDVQDYQSLVFSSFGLSGVEIPTGRRSFSPGGGLNALVMGPNETPFLLRAIAAHGDSRILAKPEVIVRDNTTATISSVEESPYTSVNASSTVATTSFGGFESAGTTLTVTPHIAQGDHLGLDYSFNFSNFTGGGSGGVPPPRATNSFSGSLEIPDDHTIIIGGMVSHNEADSVSEVPLFGRIPVLGALFQSSDRAHTKVCVYAFIKATILRDDRFADLKLISERQLKDAQIPDDDYPASEFLWMR